ncbi:MAG: glycoside hydrolase family 16 protein [Bacteroidales bacterium]|jgi:licheninase|nr:glycoside hydrolase family 16 protein [Bacteroidales bacterium]
MKHCLKYLLLICGFLWFSLSCTPPAADHRAEDPDLDAPGILFIDLFNGVDVIPDTTNWKRCTYANNAWSQHFEHVEGYENVRVEDGFLKLSATREGEHYKNGGIRTRKGFPGNTRVEVRARLTKQVRGGFPAIWQMPVGAPAWPRGGEIDLMEWVQGTPDQIYQTVHTFYINGPEGSAGVTNPNPDRAFDVTQFHLYAAERTDEAVIFYVDGEESWRYENIRAEETEVAHNQFPFMHYPFDIILNFSLGGTLNGNTTWAGVIHNEELPGELWIDWVMVSAVESVMTNN